jgi:hypothetical protein
MTAKEARDAELTLELWVRDARESKLPPLSQVPLIWSDVSRPWCTLLVLLRGKIQEIGGSLAGLAVATNEVCCY